MGAQVYVLLSPFTSWTLEVLPGINPGVDLSTVTALQLNFTGAGH